MTRYCQQRDRYSCGPIALLNIDKFFGRRVTYKHLPWYSKRTECSKADGTYTSAISKILGRASRRTWQKTKQFLNDLGCVMVQTIQHEGHYYLMVIGVDGNISVVNYTPNKFAAVQITPQKGDALLRGAYRTWYVSEPTRRTKL